MKEKKNLQTSLRMVRCQFCDNWIKTENLDKHIFSNCKDFVLWDRKLKQEQESKPLENDENLTTSHLRLGKYRFNGLLHDGHIKSLSSNSLDDIEALQKGQTHSI